MTVSSALLRLWNHPTPVPVEKVKVKVKGLRLVTGPKTMVLEDKIVVNVAKFLVPLPPQDALNPAVTAVTVRPQARVAVTVRPVRIGRSVPIVV